MARRVPFMAFTGVGSQLGAFARSFSRANLARLGSRIQSYANLSKLGHSQNGLPGSSSYGSMGDVLGPAPSPLDGHHRDASEGSSMFGNTFDLDLEDDLEGMQPGFTVALGMAVFTAVLASFQVGFNSGVLNVPQTTIVAALHLSTLQWSFAVAIFCIGGLLGSMSGARMADRLGRKNFLIANNVLFIVGGLLESLAGDEVMLSLGRLAIGVGCGGATVVVPMYLGEIAPANLRGSLGTMNQFAMVIGILVANLLGKPLGTAHTWRYLLGLCLVPALLQIIMAATLLESPLWLLSKGGAKNRMHAEEVLSALRGTDDVEFDLECMEASVNNEDDLDEEEHEHQQHAEEDAERGDGAASWGDEEYQSRHRLSSSSGSGGEASPRVGANGHAHAHPHGVEKGSLASLSAAHRSRSLWAPEHRRPLLIGFGLQLVQQFSGINAVFFYSTSFFASAHMSDPWLGSVLASTVNVLATGMSIYLIERMGRRKLLLISTAGMMLSCVGLTYALMAMTPPTDAAAMGGVGATPHGSVAGAHAPTFAPPSWVGPMAVGMVLVFVSFFEVGLGPIPWLIGAEIFPNRIRSQAMGISSTINWMSNFAVGLSFPSLSLALGPLSFVPFGVVLLFAFILEYRFVPETQGKSLEEIQDDFLRAAGLGEDVYGGDEEEDEDGFGGSSIGDATPSRMAGGLSEEDDDDDEDAGSDDEEQHHGGGGGGYQASAAGSGALFGARALHPGGTPISEGVEDEDPPSVRGKHSHLRRGSGSDRGAGSGSQSRARSDDAQQ